MSIDPGRSKFISGFATSRNFLWKSSFFKMPEKLFGVIGKFYDEYMNSTPKKLKIIDAYLFYVMLTGIVQFLYCALVGTFPFNSFLSGFISCVGTFVIGGLLYDKFNNLVRGNSPNTVILQDFVYPTPIT